MIKINLIPQGKSFKSLSFLRHINFPFFIVSLLLLIVPSLVNEYMWDLKIANKNKILSVKKKEYKKLNKEVLSKAKIQRMISEFDRQVEKLKVKEKQVKKVIQTKKNPFDILIGVSKLTGKDMWIEKLNVDGKKFLLSGYSQSFKSIDTLLVNLNNTVYFSKSMRLDSTSTKEVKIGRGTRKYEYFKLSGTIKRFN